MARDWGYFMDNINIMLDDEGFTLNEKIVLLDTLMDQLQDELNDEIDEEE